MTVVLDTNVVSEIMRDEPHPDVLVWLDGRPTRELFVTAVTEAEVRTGIAFLPAGKRRRAIADAADRAFGGLFGGRVLPFDSEAARAYAGIAAARRAAGRPVSQADGQIAAIAHARGMVLATRNIRDFADMGIELIDPWAGA